MSWFKNVAGQGVYLYAHDKSADASKTGDAANITGKISKDGAVEASYATANPTEIGGGLYWQPLSQAESNANQIGCRWSSTTANVVIDPVMISTEIQQTGDSFARMGAPAGASLAADVVTLKDLLEADLVLEKPGSGAWKVHLYKKGTTTDLVTAKRLLDHAGGNITSADTAVASQRE